MRLEIRRKFCNRPLNRSTLTGNPCLSLELELILLILEAFYKTNTLKVDVFAQSRPQRHLIRSYRCISIREWCIGTLVDIA